MINDEERARLARLRDDLTEMRRTGKTSHEVLAEVLSKDAEWFAAAPAGEVVSVPPPARPFATGGIITDPPLLLVNEDGCTLTIPARADEPAPVPPPVDALLDLVDELHSAVRDDDSTGIDRARGNIVMAARDLWATGVEEGRRREERESLQVIEERDEARETADRLANAVGRHLGLDVGEHSNMNDPWMVALDALAEADGGKFVKGAYDDGVAEGRRQATEERTEEQRATAVTVKGCLGVDRGHGKNDVHYWRCPTPECAGHLCRKDGLAEGAILDGRTTLFGEAADHG